MYETIRIPEERKAVLIGPGGKVKKRIETLTSTRINVGEDVIIEGEGEGLLKCIDIVKAISRGFSPAKAMILAGDEHQLYIISMQSEKENIRKRLFSRVIGSGGRAKNIIEKSTGCHISIYGKTVSIIGNYEKIEKAIDAVEDLLNGRTHGHAFYKLKK